MLVGAAPRATTTDPERYLAGFIDPSAKPGDDFFQYAVGKWLREHPIPANERAWGIGRVVQEETYQRLVGISRTAAANAHATRGSNEQKIGDFWHASMDTITIAKQGIAPLRPEFARIDSVRDRASLLRTIGRLQYLGVGALYGMYIFQDEKSSDRYARPPLSGRPRAA